MTPTDTLTKEKIVSDQKPAINTNVRRPNNASLVTMRAQDAKRVQEQDKRNALLFPRDVDFA